MPRLARHQKILHVISSVLLWLAGFTKRCDSCIPEGVALSFSPIFRPRPSTSVLLCIESILYPESYCPLDRTRIHSLFDEEDFFDWFRTPHYPALFHAASAHRSLDNGSRGW